ncbi:MAG: hypothetical protein LBG57_00365 [Treponema sp.]|nr:hypothetical protein [Treponema sp.]
MHNFVDIALQTPKGAQKSEVFAVKGRKNPQVPQAPRRQKKEIMTLA